jgi:homocysteine S-methyltransferase
MSKYRDHLPQLGERPFLTDGGLETTLVFHRGIELPYFAAFHLLNDDGATETLRRYFDPYLAIARAHGTGFMLEAPTWRANPAWAERLGYDRVALADANRTAIGLMLEVRDDNETPNSPMVISGNIGPRGDGYRPDARMSPDAARRYHGVQIETFAETDADVVSAFTMNYIGEAVGIVHAARDAGMPVVISFTVETDGRLPSGDSLADAIRRTDDATGGYAAYYMINCAHPTHFEAALDANSDWARRLRGARANASCRSHAELDEAPDLDIGDPIALGNAYADLLARHPQICVIGGCCGTDHRHVAEMARACLSPVHAG